MPRSYNKDTKEEKSKKILSAASKLLRDKSYNDVKVVDIAHECGYSKGTVFQYFATKEMLFLNVLEKEYEIRFANFLNYFSNLETYTKETVKEFLNSELDSVLDKDSNFMKLTLIKNIILEQNMKYEYAKDMKKRLHSGLLGVAKLVNERCPEISVNQVARILNQQNAIVTGVLSNAYVSDMLYDIFVEEKLDEFIIDFKKDVIELFDAYLEYILK